MGQHPTDHRRPVPSPPAPAPRSLQQREGVRAPATAQPASRPLGLTRGAPMVSMSCLLIVNLSQVRVGFVRSTSRRSTHVSPHRTWLCTVQVRKRRFGLESRNVCRKHIKLCKKGQRVREKGGVSDLSPGSRAKKTLGGIEFVGNRSYFARHRRLLGQRRRGTARKP